MISATACSISAPTVVCTDQIVPGIVIKVQNAATGAPVTDSADVQVTDGSYVETYRYLGPPNQQLTGTITAAGERAGTYGISVRKIGFAPYDTAGVRVTKDVCHVHTVTVVASLQPIPSG